jgi:hypothetical protein
MVNIVIVLLAVLWVSNWFFSEVLVLIPLKFLDLLGSLGHFSLLLGLFFFLSWCFGE